MGAQTVKVWIQAGRVEVAFAHKEPLLGAMDEPEMTNEQREELLYASSY